MNIETKVQEILKTYGLDFLIEKAPLTATTSKGKTLITPYYGLINSKTLECINTTKDGYTVSQNAEVVEMVLEGISKFGDDLKVTKAGSIDGGRKVFFQLEIVGKAKVGNDTITKYITIVDSNDGSTSLAIGIGDINMWCKNQFFKFYKGSNAKFRHTATIAEKIASIPSLIELALDESMKQIKIYNQFLSTPLTKNLADKMVKEVLGYDRVFTSQKDYDKLTKRSIGLMDQLYKDIKIETDHAGENMWGLFNGVTRFTTYEKKEYRKENGAMESMLLGRNYKKAIAGFSFLEHELA